MKIHYSSSGKAELSGACFLNGSLAFDLEIAMSKMSLVLVGQLRKKSDEILEKIEQDRHISIHEIAYGSNIYYQIVLSPWTNQIASLDSNLISISNLCNLISVNNEITS